MPVFSLEGQRVAVMGGSSGIGLGIARMALEQGAETTIVSRSPEKLTRAAQGIGKVETASVDLREPEAVAQFFAVRDPFDHVAVSAAEFSVGPLRKTSLEQSRMAMESKFWTAAHVAREAKIMPGGSLTLVSGILSRKPSGQATMLTAINAALEAFSQALALELAPVRVNCVSPGRIDTQWWDRLPPEQRREVLARTAARLPVGRVGEAEDVARQVIACMTNTFMTGSVVTVDGGDAIAGL